MKSLYKSIGIYFIRNKITGIGYVGQTANNFGDRRDSNFAKLRHGKHDNVLLQEDWDKYGEDNYEFVVLEELESPMNIDEREKFWIAKMKEDGKSFNLQTGGKGFCGMHLSDQHKKAIGEKNRIHNLGKKATEETKQKMSKSHKGMIVTEETKQKLRIANLGRKQTEEMKLKNSISHSGDKCCLAKYTKEQVLMARELYTNGNHNYKDIAVQTGINRDALYDIIARKRWKYI